MGIEQTTVIVVPCFNEAARLHGQAFLTHLAGRDRLHFVFVDDGSQDATGATLDTLAAANPRQVHVVHLSKNGGKAEAVGTVKKPGPLYGVKSYAWPALAVAVTALETKP